MHENSLILCILDNNLPQIFLPPTPYVRGGGGMLGNEEGHESYLELDIVLGPLHTQAKGRASCSCEDPRFSSKGHTNYLIDTVYWNLHHP